MRALIAGKRGAIANDVVNAGRQFAARMTI